MTFDPKKFPLSSGVYLHKSEQGDIIYVGKAKSLRRRISSYFQKMQHDPKTELLVKNIAATDFIITNNELEALLLENRLIKKHQPKFNIALKETARYYYICVTKELFPRVLVTRKTNKKDKFFGPYTSSPAKITKIVRELFKIRSCVKMPKRTCIYYDLNLCGGPCEQKVSQAEYQQGVREATQLIGHGDEKLAEKYREEMHEASRKMEYETALDLRRRIALLEQLSRKQVVDTVRSFDQDVVGIATHGKKSWISILKLKRGVITTKQDFQFLAADDLLDEFLKAYYGRYAPPAEILVDRAFDPEIIPYLEEVWGEKVQIIRPERGDKKQLLAIAKKNAYARFCLEDPVLIELKDMLKLDEVPLVIDCFDISNYGEQVIVGACVQYRNREPYKSAYRLYNIKGDFGQDDFRSMQEVVQRRYSKMELPNLILVDGGQVQVDFALRALKELDLVCHVRGLAKREETIIFPVGNSLVLNRRLPASKLIMRMRDDVHRFAISHSRRKFKVEYKHSVLDEIVGIGEGSKFALLQSFGSIDAIKTATFDELAKVVGKRRALLVQEYFNKEED